MKKNIVHACHIHFVNEDKFTFFMGAVKNLRPKIADHIVPCNVTYPTEHEFCFYVSGITKAEQNMLDDLFQVSSAPVRL